MHIYSEDQVHTYLNCNTLYFLEGSITDPSVYFSILKYSIHTIYNTFISANRINSLDDFVFKIISDSINTHLNTNDYPPNHIVLLKRYLIDFFHTLVKWYPPHKYLPIAVNLEPLYTLQRSSYSSTIDLVFKSKNRKHLHGVVFTQNLDTNYIYKNPFTYLNLNYLKKYASFSIKKNLDVFSLHYIKPDPFTIAYSSTKDWKVTRTILNEKDLTSLNLKYAFNILDNLNFNKLTHKSFCAFTKCKKRKECNELRRF